MARKIFNGLDLTNQRIINLGSPSQSTDAANKAYVDALVNGKAYKQGVRVASTANVDVSQPGSVIDGVTLSPGDSVLLKNQSNPAENGIYVYNGASTAMIRRSDANSSDNLRPNTTVFVSEGEVNADTEWTLTTDAPITVGVTELVWAQSNASSMPEAGDGLTRSGTTLHVNPGNGLTIDGVSGKVMIDPTVVARKYSATVGDNVSTVIAVTHNLGTRNVVVSVHDAATYEEVYPDVTKTDPNTVTLIFAQAPATSSLVVTVIG